MLFVLAAMLLLMAIGVSALTAAGANFGARLSKRDENQLNLYMNSMELTLRTALNRNDMKERILQMADVNYGDDGGDVYIALGVNPADYGWAGLTFPGPITITGTLTRNITQHFRAYVPAVPPELDEDGDPIPGTGSPAEDHVPQRERYQGNVEVVITARFRGITAMSVTRYWFNDGVLEESSHIGPAVVRPFTIVYSYGNDFEFRRHERVNWVN
jgi:hypothetical protein